MRLLALLGIFVLFFTLANADVCSMELEGTTYDLTSANKDGQDYVAYDVPKPSKKPNTYYFQPCQNTIQSCVNNPASPVCQNDTNGNFHSCGLLASQNITGINSTIVNAMGQNITANTTIVTIYTGGQNGRASAILMICDETTTGAVKGQVIQIGASTYYIPFHTQYACGGSSGGKGGVVFIIIFFTLLGVYFIGGALFMKFARGASGKEIIPNVEFWADLPSLIKDGFMFIVNKARGRQSYSTVP